MLVAIIIWLVIGGVCGWLAGLVMRNGGGILTNIVVGIAIDPTSHNLWPFEIVMVSAAGVVWLGLLRLLRNGAAPSPTAHTTTVPPAAPAPPRRRRRHSS